LLFKARHMSVRFTFMHCSMFRTTFIICIVCFLVFESSGAALKPSDDNSQEEQSAFERIGDHSLVTMKARRNEDFTMMD
ncbi:hypothetical protein T4B_7077, partial [Trichinella pseudospiralis]